VRGTWGWETVAIGAACGWRLTFELIGVSGAREAAGGSASGSLMCHLTQATREA